MYGKKGKVMKKRSDQSHHRTLIGLLAIGLVLWVPDIVSAQSHPFYARNGMVVSAEAHASEVGVEILKQGGNAFDAAAAVGFALAVVAPHAGNIGGGGFCVALKADGESLALDMRETAPSGAAREMFLDSEGKVIAGLSLDSYLAVGVPGTVDGLLKLQRDHGVLTRKEILAPAIRLAEEGFPASHFLSAELERNREFLTRHPATTAVFFDDGHAIGFGELLRQSDLSRTLRRIQRDGRDGFYGGLTADLIVEAMNRNGGRMTKEDLAGYESKYRDPLTFSWGGFELITHPLPSSGGIALAQILGVLDPDRLKRAPHNGAEYVSLLTEAERLAYADRNFFLGDNDYADVPVKELISEEYLKARGELLPKDREAESSQSVGHGDIRAVRNESEETTHYCVADAAGNVVAITTTLNRAFGMGAVVDGAGFLLNNEMDDFSAKPGTPNLYGLTGAEANAIAPGKRMLSSMTPVIVTRNHRFVMTMGSPGGSTIITTVLQIFLNRVVWGMNIRDAIDAGRFHHQWLPDQVFYEPQALGWETIMELESRGYPMAVRSSLGRAAGIEATPEGDYAGCADRRGPGVVMGY